LQAIDKRAIKQTPPPPPSPQLRRHTGFFGQDGVFSASPSRTGYVRALSTSPCNPANTFGATRSSPTFRLANLLSAEGEEKKMKAPPTETVPYICRPTTPLNTLICRRRGV